MPELIAAGPGDVFFQSFALGKSLGENRKRLKDQRRQLEIQEGREKRQQQEFDFRIAQAKEQEARADQEREKTKQAEIEMRKAVGIQAKGLRSQAEAGLGGPNDAITKRTNRIGNIAKRLVEAGRSREAQQFMEQERENLQREIVGAAFEAELEEVQDLVEDGLVPPEMGNEMARIVQVEMGAGRRPGEVSQRVRAVRDAEEKRLKKELGWQQADQRAEALITSIVDTDLRQEMQSRWTADTMASTRRKEDPDRAVRTLQLMHTEASRKDIGEEDESVISQIMRSPEGRQALAQNRALAFGNPAPGPFGEVAQEAPQEQTLAGGAPVGGSSSPAGPGSVESPPPTSSVPVPPQDREAAAQANTKELRGGRVAAKWATENQELWQGLYQTTLQAETEPQLRTLLRQFDKEHPNVPDRVFQDLFRQWLARSSQTVGPMTIGTAPAEV